MRSLTHTEFLAKPEVEEVITDVRRALRRVLPEGTFGEREVGALALLNEALRSLLEEDLQMISDGFAEHLRIDGVEFKLHELASGTYHSLAGALHARRATYREVGVRNGPTVVPLELVAGLAENATPAFAYNVVHGYGQRDMRQHAETLAAAHRASPPRATLERMAKRLASKAVDVSPCIEAVLRQTETLPEGARAISIGLDRTAVPMAEERPADAAPRRPRKRRKPRQRRAPAPIDVNYRMAYVATATIVDEHGEALVTRRYAAPACDDPTMLVRRMMADVRTAVRRGPHLAIGVMQDGAPELWALTRDGLAKLDADGVIHGWEEGIDRYHLLERLGKSLEIIESDPSERRRKLHEWNERLDLKDSAIDRIERELSESWMSLPEAKQEELIEHLIYISNNKDRMRYVSLSTSGLPVGSGVTESAAKTVVGRRAKNSGQRWSQAGLRGALTLRAIHQSERLPRFWSYMSRRYTAAVEEAA